MTTRQFRTLLIASLIIGIFGGLLDLIHPKALPEAFALAVKQQDDALPAWLILFLAGGTFVGLTLFVVATIGLYRFRPWAPRLALISTALNFFVIGPGGAVAWSGWAIACLELSASMWGAVLAVTYFSPLKANFYGVENSAEVHADK